MCSDRALSVFQIVRSAHSLKRTLTFFLGGSLSDYITFVEKYQRNPLVLKAAKDMKECVDTKLRKADKDFASKFLVSLCVWLRSLSANLLIPGWEWGLCSSPWQQFLCESRNMIHLTEDVRRKGHLAA